jgi:lysophospholipase L1-like esterase
VLAIALTIVEIGVRIVSAIVVGPRVLVYGTRWHRRQVQPPENLRRGVAFHTNEAAGYVKYFPNEEKWANDSRGHYRVRINAHGLRGPEFAVAKRPGVARVLTLGASSTFGFENRDDETYPYYLQRALDRAAGRGRFEVINFAVPHADSDAMVSLFLAEGVALMPDVVTVYEGINDSERAVYDEIYGTSWRPSGRAPFLTVQLVRQLASAVLPKPSRVAVTDTMIAAATGHYLGNLDAIAAACRSVGARMIVVTQQARSLMIEPARLHGTTYADEVRFVEAALPAPDAPDRFNAMQLHVGAMLAVHARLMEAMRGWAATRHVPLVDGVAALDRQRDLLLTWVHLAPPANKALAKILAPAVLHAAQEAHTPTGPGAKGK